MTRRIEIERDAHGLITKVVAIEELAVNFDGGWRAQLAALADVVGALVAVELWQADRNTRYWLSHPAVQAIFETSSAYVCFIAAVAEVKLDIGGPFAATPRQCEGLRPILTRLDVRATPDTDEALRHIWDVVNRRATPGGQHVTLRTTTHDSRPAPPRYV